MTTRLFAVITTLLFATSYAADCRADWDADLEDGILYITGDNTYQQTFVLVAIEEDNEILIFHKDFDSQEEVDEDDGNFLDWHDEDYDLDDVQLIIFEGFGGRDDFTNFSPIPSMLYGGPGNDVLTGGVADDIIDGGAGQDHLYGGPFFSFSDTGAMYSQGLPFYDEEHDGNDVLYGRSGMDTLYGGTGHDELRGGADADFLDGGPDSDVLDFGDDAVERGANVTLDNLFQKDLVIVNSYVSVVDGEVVAEDVYPEFMLSPSLYHNYDGTGVKHQFRLILPPSDDVESETWTGFSKTPESTRTTNTDPKRPSTRP